MTQQPPSVLASPVNMFSVYFRHLSEQLSSFSKKASSETQVKVQMMQA
jgi:hypothetical protein